jgi:DNA-binding response OmpR family regulator
LAASEGRAVLRILLVEDDDRVAGALTIALRRAGFDVHRVATGKDALDAGEVQIVLLDLGLPDMDGVEVCRELRRRSDVPIIAVTARSDERDRVMGLRTGADDYVVKPFGAAELIARIEAVLRRSRRVDTADATIDLGGVVVSLAGREVTRDGTPIPVTRKEFDLLALLAKEPGTVVTRDRILAEVWHTTWQGSSHTLDVHVASLRTKLGLPDCIETVRGVGYRLRTK